MQADIRAGNEALAAQSFIRARAAFRKALDRDLTPVEERVCRNRLKEVERRIKQLGKVARITVSHEKDDGFRRCRVRVLSSDAGIQHMCAKVFTHVVRTRPDEEAAFEQTGNALSAKWKAAEDGLACGACKRYRAMVKDNLGRDGFLEESWCEFE